MENFVNKNITCDYQGEDDPAPLVIEGKVVKQRIIPEKGTLLLVQTSGGYRSIYLEKAQNLLMLV